MVNQEQLDRLLKQGVQTWNQWRKEHPEIHPDLSNANLIAAELYKTNFGGTDLTGANLKGANLTGTLQLHFLS